MPGTIRLNTGCPWADEGRDDPHPSINMAVMFDGPHGDVPLTDLLDEVEGFATQLRRLIDGGATICERDGRHIFYHPKPGQDDPFAWVPVEREGA